ncbi:MAG: L-seryl-tRNA(Sec) selenium transferase, partial [Proteobacteria bacterium]|nr:L-seryl-tRNA(Sec) selenium transferase [Pseudomonadota bacterium]
DQINKQITILSQPSLKQVINATGVIVHTNLGRSLLAKKVITPFNTVAGCYSNLEYDLKTGKRGSRYVHVEDILIELTGAESAMVVNNNAAAVLITLDTIAKDKEVIISRGQLVEIGGSFRIPEVMRKSGARMFEIGTTNKTTIDDYEAAIVSNTALLLKVHTSNFQTVGFTEEVSLDALVALGKKYNLPVMEDLGSGCFIDFSLYGLTKEPTVQDSVAKGADIITFSGDKMLGGPQCGIILGKEKIISAIKANQLARALRVDKLTLFALQETLSLYRDEKKAIQQIPTLRMICQSYQSVCRRAKKLLNMIERVDNTNISLRLCDGFSRVGGGAMPLEEIRSRLLCISPGRLSAPFIVNLLHSYNPPIIARLEKDQVLLDVRTIQEKEVKIVAEAIKLLSATNAIS